jgi:hypothetical protein
MPVHGQVIDDVERLRLISRGVGLEAESEPEEEPDSESPTTKRKDPNTEKMRKQGLNIDPSLRN